MNETDVVYETDPGKRAYGAALKFSASLPGKIILTVLALLPALLALTCALYYILGPAEGYFHADCTDSLYWANASLEAGAVFDEYFRYAALLPFSAGIWMTPLISVFGVGMTAHNIGMVIFAVVFAASVWFCCRSAGQGAGWSSVSVCVVFLILSSSDKLREIMWGHAIYYSIGLCLLFVASGLSLRMLNGLDKNRALPAAVWGVLLLVISAGAATDGFQVIALSTLPVAGAICAECLFNGKHKLISRPTMRSAAALLAVLAGTVAGLILLNVFKGENITAGYADAYSGYSDISAWAGNAQSFFKQYLTLIGFSAANGDSLFDKESILNVIRIAGGLLMLAVPVLMLVFYRRLSGRGVRVLLWSHCVLCAAIMFGFICGKLSGANWRLTPMVGSAALLAVAGARELWLAGKKLLAGTVTTAGETGTDTSADTAPAPDGASDALPADKTAENTASGRVLCRAGSLLLALLLLPSLLSALEIKKMPADYGRDNTVHTLAAFLEEKELEYGYATFWYSQAITVISDSRVTARESMVNAAKGVYTDYYQSSRRWYADDSHDRYFVLLTDGEYTAAANSPVWKEWLNTVYITDYDDIPGFRIFVFSDNVLAAYGEK